MLIPKVATINDSNVVQFAVNEELGIHLNKPVLVCIDEFGKGNQGVIRALTRFCLERKIGMYELHPDSIVYATTNKEAKGSVTYCYRINLIELSRSRCVSIRQSSGSIGVSLTI